MNNRDTTVKDWFVFFGIQLAAPMLLAVTFFLWPTEFTLQFILEALSVIVFVATYLFSAFAPGIVSGVKSYSQLMILLFVIGFILSILAYYFEYKIAMEIANAIWGTGV